MTATSSRPRLTDRAGWVHLEHARIERRDSALVALREEGEIVLPAAEIQVLSLGPGTSVSHAAACTLAETGTTLVWVAEGGIRLYAAATGPQATTERLLRQASAWADPKRRMAVARAMYTLRFGEVVDETLDIRALRGREGLRMRAAYAAAAAKTGVAWDGRSTRGHDWRDETPINRALSTANACLYGLVASVLATVGYSLAIGFIHTGRSLSFVYDIADLYKTELTVPVAFAVVAEDTHDFERRTRVACRTAFSEATLAECVLRDADALFGSASTVEITGDVDGDGLWDDPR